MSPIEIFWGGESKGKLGPEPEQKTLSQDIVVKWHGDETDNLCIIKTKEGRSSSTFIAPSQIIVIEGLVIKRT